MMGAADLSFAFASATDPGKVRTVNEDAYLERALGDSGLWVVADGVGGHRAGDVASRMVVESLGDVAPPANLGEFIDEIEARLLVVHQRLNAAGEASSGAILGTTVAALLSHRQQSTCLWSGDSRVYRYRAGVLAQLTRDHNEAERLVRAGHLDSESARHHPSANVLTNALGGGGVFQLDCHYQALRPGDRFLLCSDGLSKELSEMDMLPYLAHGAPRAACRALLAHALAGEARDNCTVMVVDFIECR